MIYAVCSIYFHLLPTPLVLTFFRFHVCNLGLPLPSFHCCSFPPKGPVFCRCPKITVFNSMCNPKRTRVDLIWQKTRIRCGISQNVRNMLHRFDFRTDKRRGGDIIMKPPMHPQWIYSTFGERKHVINRAVFPLLHLEIKLLPFQDSNTNMDIFECVLISYNISVQAGFMCGWLNPNCLHRHFPLWVFCFTCLDACDMCQLLYMYAHGQIKNAFEWVRICVSGFGVERAALKHLQSDNAAVSHVWNVMCSCLTINTWEQMSYSFRMFESAI